MNVRAWCPDRICSIVKFRFWPAFVFPIIFLFDEDVLLYVIVLPNGTGFSSSWFAYVAVCYVLISHLYSRALVYEIALEF